MRTTFASAALLTALSGSALAAPVSVTITNTQDAGGFALTPFWLGFHDGGFDVFNAGSPASDLDGITQIAELGNTGPISARFASEQAGGVDTTLVQGDAAPVYSPGESETGMFDLDPSANRFFSFASMVVPSNDLFVGNDNAIELFDAGGNFNGPMTINIFGSMVWDNGSEVNDINDGPAFVMGVDAVGGADEGGVVHLLFADAGAGDYLNSILGTTTADGNSITSAFSESTLIATITVVPTPGAAGLVGLAGIGALTRRRRRA